MLRSKRWLGRTEFRPEDYKRALVAMAMEIFSARAKWRASQSARRTALKKCLTGGDIVRDGRFCAFRFCLFLRGKVFEVGVGAGVDRAFRLACVGPGGHFVGRFCRSSPSPPTWRTHPDTGCLQVGASRFSPHPGLLLDAPQRPSQSSQGYYLLSFRFAQDVAHADRSYNTSCRNQRPSRLLSLLGFEVALIGRF